MHHLMDRLLVARKEVPEGGGILEIGSGIALLCVDEGRELDSVSDEEDGCVVSNHVPIPFLSVELDGKPSRVSSLVGRAFLSTYSREPNSHTSFLSDFAKEICGSLLLLACSLSLADDEAELTMSVMS
jgi:hypothetical protein